MTRLVVPIAVIAVLAARTPALADPQAEAVVLFDQGIKDMKAGRLDAACTELQASLDLVKDSGTRGALARCHGLAGRVATAWLLWRALSDSAPTAELRTDAAAQARRLEPRLPRYAIRLAAKAPVVVEINGVPVATQMPVPVPIDPGKVAVTASGRDGDRVITEVFRRDYTAVEGQILVIEVPALAGLPASSGAPIVAPPVAAPAAPDDAVSRRHTRRIAALALGGVTVGLAAAGTVFGLRARSQYGDARRVCGGVIDDCMPDQVGASQQLVDRARSSGNTSSVLFGVAGATAVA